MNVKHPLISVITVCYNSEDTIEQTIQSVLSQSYQFIEFIIIDGGSIDRTIEIIKKYRDRIFYWKSEKDDGIYDAMNKGLSYATGDLISFLNSDDWYEENALEEVVRMYHSLKSPGVIHGDINIYQNDHYVKTRKPQLDTNAKLYFAWHPACFIPKKIFQKYGIFDKRYIIAGDLEFLLRLKKQKIRFHYIPQSLTNFRLEGASDNIWKGSIESFKIYRIYYPLMVSLLLLWERTVIRQLNSFISNTISPEEISKIKKFLGRIISF